MTPDEFLGSLNAHNYVFQNGYADFCKIVCGPNTPQCRTGTIPITIENYQYLRSGYSSRTPQEFAVLSRWFELPLPPPVANHLILVLYTREQLLKEHEAQWSGKTCAGQEADVPFELDEDTDYGIVTILAQMESEVNPIPPVTIMRNALGMEQGGSGVPIDPEAYSKSVEFWSQNAIVRS